MQTEIHEMKSRCYHKLIQLDFLKSNILRSYTNELNNLQLERDSLVTQTEITKYNLFEQTQQFDNILQGYRQSLKSFRSSLTELEQELKQQADSELMHLRTSNLSELQTINDDTQRLISFLENKVTEKKVTRIELQKSIDDFQEKIYQQKQILAKRENDYETMNHMDQQLNDNINVNYCLNISFYV